MAEQSGHQRHIGALPAWGNRRVAGLLSQTQRTRLSQFDSLTRPMSDVVVLGDSLVEYGLWNEWLADLVVINRGIAGDTTGGVLRRLDSAIGRQRFVVIQIGTNDLAIGRTPLQVADDVARIVVGVGRIDPDTHIVVTSVPPRQAAYRSLIVALNHQLAALDCPVASTSPAETPGQDSAEVSPDGRTSLITYLDLWPTFATPAGTLRPDFTIDGLHLTGPGYAAWVDLLRPVLDGAA